MPCIDEWNSFIYPVISRRIVFAPIAVICATYLGQFYSSARIIEHLDKPRFSGEWVRLGDVASYINGYAFKPADYASEGKPIIRIQDLTGNAYQTNRFAGNLDDKYRVVWGDVLISWSASLGVYVWSAEEAWLNQHIFKVQFNKLPVNKRFFIHQTRYVIAESASLAHGATMRHLTKKVFDNLPFFYPSEHDQEEIACHLDGIQLQIDSASDMLARLDALVKSGFAAYNKAVHAMYLR